MAHRKSLQVIMAAPARVLVGSYTTKSGQVKNRYAPSGATPFITSIGGVQRIKTIKHKIPFN